MRVRSALALLWVWLFAGCPAELKELNATEVVVRIDAAPDVLSALTSLRVRVAREQDGQWVERNARTFERADLRWPVDIVVVPRSEAEGELDFEIVIDALTNAGAPLVQQRALTSFVRRETRILRVLLARCGDQALGFVCDDDAACLGPTCQTCVDDRCQSVPRSAPESLAPFVPPPEMPVDLDAGDAPDDVQVQAEPDDAQVQVEPDDAQVQVEPDAAVDADSAQVVVCERGTRADDAGGCVDVDECTEQLDDCDDAPEACVNLLGATGYQCTCPGGYEGTGSGATGCLDINECMTGAAQCGTLVPCSNVDGSYKCGDCPAGYRENASGDCEDVNECSSANGGCDTMPMANCHNQTGAANTCSCPAGYTGNGRGSAGCVDFDECSVNNGGCDRDPMATCHNQTGAANTCSCPAGYTGDGRGSAGCVDINECSVNNGGCDTMPMANCHNQTGAANTCSCPAGYTGDGRGSAGCVDINECSVNNGGCDRDPDGRLSQSDGRRQYLQLPGRLHGRRPRLHPLRHGLFRPGLPHRRVQSESLSSRLQLYAHRIGRQLPTQLRDHAEPLRSGAILRHDLRLWLGLDLRQHRPYLSADLHRPADDHVARKPRGYSLLPYDPGHSVFRHGLPPSGGRRSSLSEERDRRPTRYDGVRPHCPRASRPGQRRRRPGADGCRQLATARLDAGGQCEPRLHHDAHRDARSEPGQRRRSRP